jgi:hypothetical protein
MAENEEPALLGLTTIDRRFAELAKGKGYARACRIAEAERALADAAMTYARGPMSDTVGALRGLADAARALANVREDRT